MASLKEVDTTELNPSNISNSGSNTITVVSAANNVNGVELEVICLSTAGSGSATLKLDGTILFNALGGSNSTVIKKSLKIPAGVKIEISGGSDARVYTTHTVL